VSELAIRDEEPVDALSRRAGTAVASSALRGVLTGARCRGRILGTSSHAWWCTIGETVVVITDDRAVRLPNAVIARPAPTAGDQAPPFDTITVGDGELRVGGRDWRVVRWWDPRVVPVDVDAAELAGRAVAEHIADADTSQLAVAVLAGDPQRFVEAAGRLIGRGAGLTPEGDDVVSGFVAGYRHAAAAIGDTAATSLVDQLREPLLSVARSATNQLSLSLLRHTLDGEVAAPVGSLLRALTGRGEVAAAIAATRSIGHRSGPALAHGVIAGVVAACGAQP
jgi:hypothetical protein